MRARVFRRFHKGEILVGTMTELGLVLTIGKTKEHAITAIQCFNPSHLALITSQELAATTRRRLTQWKKQLLIINLVT